MDAPSSAYYVNKLCSSRFGPGTCYGIIKNPPPLPPLCMIVDCCSEELTSQSFSLSHSVG